jgi:hypothetical protein
MEKMASTSTETPLGSEPQPTAARACFPASPKTSTIKSEAPFATTGWSEKFGVALTKTPNLTHFSTKSRLPLQASCNWDKILMTQIFVAFFACSMVMSSPTLPIYFTSLFSIGNCPEIIPNFRLW